MSNEKRLEILYAHYKSIVERNRNDVRNRYRYLFYILIVVMLVLTQMAFPKDAQNFVSEFLKHSFGVSSSTNFQIVETGLLFALMLLIVRYLQIVVTVERRYPHIHYLEKQLSELFGDKVFTFESMHYLKNYPKYLDASNLLYKWIIPSIFALVALLKTGIQFPIPLTTDGLIRGLNIAFTFAIVIFVVLYLVDCVRLNDQEQNETQQADKQPSTAVTRDNTSP